MRPELLLLWGVFLVAAAFAASLLWSGLARQSLPAMVLGPLLGALLGAGATILWVEARVVPELRLRPLVQVIPSSRLLHTDLARHPAANRALDLWLADVEARTARLTRAGVLVLDESLLPQAALAELPAAWWLPTLDFEALLEAAGGGADDADPALGLPFQRGGTLR